jgi:hypothetical protein
MHVKEALGGSSRLEPLHLALSSPYRLMRVLRPIVLPKPLFVRTRQSQAPQRWSVGAQLSVTSNFGANPCFLRSLRISRNAARLSRPRCTSMSRTSPSWSTTRQSYIRSPAMRTTISSRCHRLLGRGRRRRKPPGDHRSELQHPAPDGFVGDVEPTFDKEILDVSVAEREAQVKPDDMLDDNRRKPVTTI